MKNNGILSKIKGNFVLRTIFDYIKGDIFMLKLLTYSKLFQKKLNIKLFNYQERYINKLRIQIDNYFFDWDNWNEKAFDKNILNKKLQEDLIKYKLDIDILKTYIIYHYKKSIEKFKENNKGKELYDFYEILIDIYSPFFDFLSKTDIFEQIFAIKISVKLIEKYNLKNDYILAFNNLNKANSKYSSIIFDYKDTNDIDYLNDFKINFKQIKKLVINNKNINDNNINIEYLLKNIFKFFDVENNLLYLTIDAYNYEANKIDENLIENFNNLKLLEYLDLDGFKLKNPFRFKIYNLKYLELRYCENFAFEENSLLNLKKLVLYKSFIVKPKSLLKLPNIEICEFKTENLILQKYSLIFDFTSFKNLKKIIADSFDFMHLRNTTLEYVEIYSKIDKSKELEKELIKKILNIKLLKEIKIELRYIENNEIYDITNINTSVTKLNIQWKNDNSDCVLYNLQNKLPNLKNLYIYSAEFN